MKYVLIILLSPFVNASIQQFCYLTPSPFKVKVEAKDEKEGMLKAGRLCFKTLTRDVYPGESEGMRLIDVCANPKPCN